MFVTSVVEFCDFLLSVASVQCIYVCEVIGQMDLERAITVFRI